MVKSHSTLRRTVSGLASLLLLSLSVGGVSAQAPKPQAARPPAAPPRSPSPPSVSTLPSVAATAGETRTTGETKDSTDGDVIARAGEARLLASDIRAFVAQANPRDQAALERDPRLLIQAARSLLANQLVLKEALAKKWEQQPAIAAQLERVRQDAIVETYLRSMSQVPEGYPADAEVESTYEANKTSFLVPRQYQLAQIVVLQAQDADKAAEEKAKKKLDEVRKSLKEPGANFATIAAQESEDPEGAAKGGDLGLLREDQIRPEIRAQISGLAVDAVSEPVRLEDGWHLFKLVETKPAYTRPLAEVRDALIERIREERQTANRRRYIGKIVEDAPMTINEIALSKLVEPSQKASSK
jgi:parvulin-like peptidyl-prolyl isomerase